jgi:putative tryptophan/tyrosine transport system substrate-binding protein
MRRSALVLTIALTLAIVAPPPTAEAQPAGRVPRLGYLSNSSSESAPDSTFIQGLRDLGWVDGRTIVIEARYAAGNLERIHEFVRDFMSRGVDVIAAWSPFAVAAAKRGTATIPIVGLSMGDPVVAGLVVSLARPGGNVTGLADLQKELHTKRVELLKETVSGIRRLAVLSNPSHPNAVENLGAVDGAARSLGLEVVLLNVSSPEELDKAFGELGGRRADGLLVLHDVMFWARRLDIVGLAAKRRVPAIYWERAYAEAGGLLSYAASLSDIAHRGAAFVDKILRGANPADLPVEQPTKFELVVNMRTAKALGLTIPPSILVRADQVIE